MSGTARERRQRAGGERFEIRAVCGGLMDVLAHQCAVVDDGGAGHLEWVAVDGAQVVAAECGHEACPEHARAKELLCERYYQ